MPDRPKLTATDVFGNSDNAAEPQRKKREPQTGPVVVASYRISIEVRDRFKALADAERVSPADLAELALLHLMDDIEAGRFAIPKGEAQYTIEYE